MIIGIALSILIPVLIYKLVRKKDEARTLKTKDYVISTLLSATLFSVPIIILELLWDRFVMPGGAVTFAENATEAFLRAALIEEAVKMFWVCFLFRKYRPQDKKEAILLAGTVGIGYGILEKIALGNGAAVLVNSFVPLHMVFQWIMGALLFKANKASEEGKSKIGGLCVAFIVPFLVHGAWDTLIELSTFMIDSKSGMIETLGTVLVVLIPIMGIVATIVAVKKMRNYGRSAYYEQNRD